VIHVTVLFSYSPHPSERDGNRRRRRASRYRPFFLLSTSISLHLGKVADSETSSSWSQINKRRTYERPTGVHFTEECQRGYVTHRHTAGRQHHLSLQRIRQCRRRRGSSSVLRQSRGLTHHHTPSRFCLPVAVHVLLAVVAIISSPGSASSSIYYHSDPSCSAPSSSIVTK